jgi:hypothetical protein
MTSSRSANDAKALIAFALSPSAAVVRIDIGQGDQIRADRYEMRAAAAASGHLCQDHPRMPIAAVGVKIVYERLLASPITNRHVPFERLIRIVPCFFGPA